MVSNNSTECVRVFLELHGPEDHVTKIVGRPSEQPHLMKPNPFPLITAAEQMHTDVTSRTLIGDSLTDIQTAHASGATVIGYANLPHKADQFIEAQADIITEGHAGHRRRTHHGVAGGQQESCYRFLYLIKAPAAHSAARAARRPGLRSCLRPAPARPPSARLRLGVMGGPQRAFRHGNRHMACVAGSTADCGRGGVPKDGQRRGRGGLLRKAGRLPGHELGRASYPRRHA
ncbi:HAD family hydrolase [Streptomyces sp. NPDC056399]|uniref:HAD family hydrolase n=1 Tax=Streptomyces sp. NPDC056399 TaxID=3345807 RepID=UPI0035E101E8